MFGEGQRQKAVDMYFREGMTLKKVIAELGYQSEGCLTNWIARDPRHGRSPSYTLDVKARAARRVIAGEHYADVAKDVGCSATSVRKWVDAYEREGIGGLMNMGDGIRVPAMDDGCDDPMELKRQIAALRLENAVMREAIAVLKAGDPRLDPCELTNREKTRVVERIRGEFGPEAALDAVTLGRSTYYHQRSAMRTGDKYAVRRERIRGLFEQGGRVRGHRTIHRLLRMDDAEPLVVSEKVVRRIMGEEGLRPVYLRKPKRWSSYRGEPSEAPASLVERDFHAERPNTLWLTDVTRFTMDGYKCRPSPVVDCFDGMVVAWRLSRSPDAAMSEGMLLDAAAEGFFGRLKNEFFHCRDWRGVGYREFRERLATYLTHYNETRIKKSLGWQSPVQYRKSLGLVA